MRIGPSELVEIEGPPEIHRRQAFAKPGLWAGLTTTEPGLVSGCTTTVGTRKEIPRPFVQGQGSIEERLNNLYNQMKHAESQIENAAH